LGKPVLSVCPQLTTVKDEEDLRYYLTTGPAKDILIMPEFWRYSTPPEPRGAIRPIERPLACLEEDIPRYEVVAASLDDAVAAVNYIATTVAAERVYVRVLAPETRGRVAYAEGLRP
jgi:hypothetical protein